MKKIFCLIFLFFLPFIGVRALENDEKPFYSRFDKDYGIEDYNIDINVGENNTFEVTEKISVFFAIAQKGILKTIPLKTMIDKNNTTSNNRFAKVKNLKVNNKYTVYSDESNELIDIGDNNKSVIGHQKYIISYLYELGKDKDKKQDEFCFIISGIDWDTKIENLSFKITMPKEFNENDLEFLDKTQKKIRDNTISYKINGNVITGSLNRTLNDNEEIIAKIKLPNEYFKTTITISLPIILGGIISFSCFLLSFILWNKYGKKFYKPEKMNYFPPEKINSLDIGYMDKGYVDESDVMSLLLYLANKGYLIIEKISEKNLLSEAEYKIIEAKEYDGDNIFEQMFMSGLFRISFTDSESGLRYVTSDILHNRFYYLVRKIESAINSKQYKKENQNKVYEKSSLRGRFVIFILLMIELISLLTIPIIDYYGRYIIPACIPFFVLCISVLISVCSLFISILPRLKEAIFLSVILIFYLLLSDLSPSFDISFFIKNIVASNFLYIFYLIVSFMVLLGTLFFYIIMPKETQDSSMMFEDINTLKYFIKNANKEKLVEITQNNPTYFYDILPYAYALGLSIRWIEKFKDTTLNVPKWYFDNYFDIKVLKSFILETIPYIVKNDRENI